MIETIKYKDKSYPKFQTEGFAAEYVHAFAKKVCKGMGFDIGCNRKEWCFSDAVPIDLEFDDEWHALNLPYDVDYIFSSHMLEHFDGNWVDVLDYWTKHLNSSGVLFLYLPHYDQEYWRPWNNRKHKHIFTDQILRDYMVDRNYHKIFSSQKDLNDSFIIMGEKR
jgi:predicted SAM-dependent methyltransferase